VIILDTNVVSEGWKPRPSIAVTSWLNAQAPQELYLCTPVLTELRYGVARLPPGKRREYIETWVNRLEGEIYRDRILTLDVEAAAEFGRLAARREELGRRMAPMDALIAGIAASQGASIATRDTTDFDGIGIDLINPFEPQAGE
jgi:predicted nucleic acid-binding protein